MIEIAAQGSQGQGARLTLRPPRALNAFQFKLLFCACSALMLGMAAISWYAGNVFAPAFAVLQSGFIAFAFRAVWKSGQRDEVIAIDPEKVEVWRSALPVPAFQAHPYWVRLRASGDGERVMLSSSGRYVEVGALLGPAERRQLAGQLSDLLAAALRS